MRRRTTPGRTAVLAIVAAAALASCGKSSERSLCEAYDQYVTAVDPILAQDPAEMDSDGALAAVEDVQAELNQLAAAADDRFSAPIDDLRVALDDLASTLDSLDDPADFATWSPLVADELETARDAGVRLRSQLDIDCPRAT